MYRSIYFIILSFSQNIVFNYYLFLFAIFPTYFKNSVVNAKKTSDLYYNKMMLLSFTDDIYNKYHIDLINVHANIIKYINREKNENDDNDNENNDDNNDDNENNENKNDNISVMSDLSDLSDMSEFSNVSNCCEE